MIIEVGQQSCHVCGVPADAMAWDWPLCRDHFRELCNDEPQTKGAAMEIATATIGDRRLAAIEVSKELLGDMFSSGYRDHGLEVTEGVPASAKLVMITDQGAGILRLIYTDPSFTAVDPELGIPLLSIQVASFRLHPLGLATGILDKHLNPIKYGDRLRTGMRQGDEHGWTTELVVRGSEGLPMLEDPETFERMQMQRDQELRELECKSVGCKNGVGRKDTVCDVCDIPF